MENNCQYEEYHESYVKVNGGNADKIKGKDENGFGLINSHGCGLSRLGKNQGSFKGLKDGKISLEENTQENTRKSSSLHRLVPTVSFNNRPSKKLSTIFRLSFKRKSCDAEESTELGMCLLNYNFKFGNSLSIKAKSPYFYASLNYEELRYLMLIKFLDLVYVRSIETMYVSSESWIYNSMPK